MAPKNDVLENTRLECKVTPSSHNSTLKLKKIYVNIFHYTLLPSLSNHKMVLWLDTQCLKGPIEAIFLSFSHTLILKF